MTEGFAATLPDANAALAGRRELLIASAVAFVVLAIGIAAVAPYPVGAFQDDAMYVVLARALASGEGYRFINLPGSPAATHFPPGYPAFLALVSFVAPAFPRNLVAFKMANAALLAVAAGFGYLLARRRLLMPEPAAVLATLMGALALPALLLSGMVLSETLLLALLLPALLLAERAVADARPGSGKLAVLGLLGGTMALVRTVGIAFPLGVALVLLLAGRRMRAAAIVLGVTTVVLMPWQWWVATHAAEMPTLLAGKYGSYGGWLGSAGGVGALVAVAAASVGRNLTELWGMTGTLFSPVPAYPVRPLASGVVVALLAAGAWRVRHRAPATVAVLVVYFGIVMLWPFNPTRFAWGLWLPLTLLLGAGALAAHELRHDARLELRPRRAVHAVALGLVFFVVAGTVRYSVTGYLRGWHTAIQRSGAEAASPVVRWAAANGAESDLLASDDELMVYLYAGRHAIPVALTSSDEHVSAAKAKLNSGAGSMRALIAGFPVRYVLVRATSSAFAAETLYRAAPPQLTLVATLPGGGAVFTPASGTVPAPLAVPSPISPFAP